MKLYLASNEAGLHGDYGLHTRLAVLSARANTDFEPVLLYAGERNAQTRWLERHGVEVRDSALPYVDTIRRLADEGRYWTEMIGHWLRTNICFEETADRYVLYTDIDVLFMNRTRAERQRPRLLSAAPEFQKDRWDYFNSGVMVLDAPGLRRSYEAFERFIVANIEQRGLAFHDQIAFNEFYAGQWSRLPVEMNWKPYWGYRDDIDILHFHGPKLGAINSILDEVWDWSNAHGTQIGSLFAASYDDYRRYLAQLCRSGIGMDEGDHDFIAGLHEKMQRLDAGRFADRVDARWIAELRQPPPQPDRHPLRRLLRRSRAGAG